MVVDTPKAWRISLCSNPQLYIIIFSHVSSSVSDPYRSQYGVKKNADGSNRSWSSGYFVPEKFKFYIKKILNVNVTIPRFRL